LAGLVSGAAGRHIAIHYRRRLGMSRTGLACTTALLLSIFAGCSPDKGLTPSKVKSALANEKGFIDCDFTITGIRVGQDPEGQTVVDLELKCFKWEEPGARWIRHDYSGPAVAYFTGYTNGQWTLRRYEFRDQQGRRHSFTSERAGDSRPLAQILHAITPWQFGGAALLLALLCLLLLKRILAARQRPALPESTPHDCDRPSPQA
jgi:hypothetical protein